MSKTTIEALRDLIDRYWTLAYAEGKEGRDCDTPDGDAQQVRSQIEAALAALSTHHPEAQQPEAVAWMHVRKRDGFIRGFTKEYPTEVMLACAEGDGDEYRPVYTTPPKPAEGGVVEGFVLVPVEPTEAMLIASCAAAPYICRRRMDKTAYEVVRLDGPDWPEVITDEQTVMFTGPEDEAELERGRLTAEYRYATMLAAAPKPATTTGEGVGSDGGG